MKGPALEVARQLELESEQTQKYLVGNPGERALHARAVSLAVVACHEQSNGWVIVEMFGHQGGDGEQNVSVTVGSIAPEPETPSPGDIKQQAIPADPVQPEPVPTVGGKRGKLK